MSEIATLALQIEAAQFNSGLERARRQAEELGVSTGRLTVQTDHLVRSLKSAGATLLSLYAGNKMVGFFREATESAASFREDLAQFQHVFRNVRSEADAMIETLTNNQFGRTKREAMQLTMGMGSMLKSIGMTDRAAVGMSGQIAQLAVDIGSFQSRNASDVLNAVQSAILGETAALQTYGVFLNEATLKSRVAMEAQKGLTFTSEREARAHAILAEIQHQQADALGDYAAESGNYRGQVELLTKRLAGLKTSIGEAFIEPATNVIRSINSVVGWISKVDAETLKFVSRTSALVVGIGTARTALTALGPILSFMTGRTIANAGAVTAETAAVTTNTIAWGANTMARRGATASSFSRMAIPGLSTSSTVGMSTLTAVGAGGTGTAGAAGAFGLTGTAAVALPLAAIASIGASVVKTGYDLQTGEKDFNSFGGAVNTLLGTISAGPEMILRSVGYYDMWAKWGEKSVKKLKVRDGKTGEMIDHDEYVRRFRERPEIKKQNEEAAQRAANGGLTDAQLRQKKYDEGLAGYNRFVADQNKTARFSKMNDEDKKYSLETDLLNISEELNRALELGEFDKAMKLSKERFKIQSEIGRLDESIEQTKKQAAEKALATRKYAEKSLYDFQYQNAGRSQRRQMAVSAFSQVSKNFDKLTSHAEKQKAVEEMKVYYSQIQEQADKGIPTWNGVKSNSAGAIESGSVQARELQSRVFNDVNKGILEQSKKQTELQRRLTSVMEEMLNELKGGTDFYSISIND